MPLRLRLTGDQVSGDAPRAEFTMKGARASEARAPAKRRKS